MPKKYNYIQVRMDGDADILIHSKKYGSKSATISKQDIEKVMGHTWRLRFDKTINGFYVQTNITTKNGYKTISLHRFILDYKGSKQIDHINRCTLDNRRCNLRIVDAETNAQNTKIKSTNKSGYKGIYFCKTHNRWIIKITRNKKVIFRKYNKTKEEAIYNLLEFKKGITNE